MMRKDCGQSTSTRAPKTRKTAVGWRHALTVVATLAGGAGAESLAGSVRMWPAAVVVADSIRLDDLCELRGLDPSTEARLASLPIADAPAAGGSRVIHLEMIRSALAAQGVNLGDVTVEGAVRCEVRRPSMDESPGDSASERVSAAGAIPGCSTVGAPRSQNSRRDDDVAVSTRRSPTEVQPRAEAAPMTLRAAVLAHFNAHTARFQGTAEVVFDRTDEQVLDLSGPEYTFHVRVRDDAKLGMVPLEIDVLNRDRIVQTVPLVVQVTLLRPTVVARRAVNQGATIQSADVEVLPLRYSDVSRLGIDDAARVVGQRAKRLIRAGAMIEPDLLEQVPLVVRGQLVSIASVVGGVRVVTSGKAAGDGLLGERVIVRTSDHRKTEIDAIVVGPGQVQLGGDTSGVRAGAPVGGGGS